jgi:hypothetical protein
LYVAEVAVATTVSAVTADELAVVETPATQYSKSEAKMMSPAAGIGAPRA